MRDVCSKDVRASFDPGRILLASIVCLLVATACGGGSGINTDGSGATGGDDEVTSTAGAGGSAETTSSSVSNGDEGSPTDSAGVAGGQDAEFCVWIRGNAADDTDFSDPVATEESMKRNLAEAEEIRSEVPAEVADDFEVVYQSIVATEAAFAENGYNLFAIPDGVLEEIATDEVIDASVNISEYCGAGL